MILYLHVTTHDVTPQLWRSLTLFKPVKTISTQYRTVITNQSHDVTPQLWRSLTFDSYICFPCLIPIFVFSVRLIVGERVENSSVNKKSGITKF